MIRPQAKYLTRREALSIAQAAFAAGATHGDAKSRQGFMGGRLDPSAAQSFESWCQDIFPAIFPVVAQPRKNKHFSATT